MSQNDLVLSHSAEAGMNWSKYSQFCALAKIMSLSVRIIDNAFPLRTSPCQDLRISSRPTKLKNEVIRVSFSSSFFSPYNFSFSFFSFFIPRVFLYSHLFPSYSYPSSYFSSSIPPSSPSLFSSRYTMG